MTGAISRESIHSCSSPVRSAGLRNSGDSLGIDGENFQLPNTFRVAKPLFLKNGIFVNDRGSKTVMAWSKVGTRSNRRNQLREVCERRERQY